MDGALPRHLANNLQHGFVNISGEDDDVINHTEKKLLRGSTLTVALYVVLVAAIVALAPAETYEVPEGLDRDCHLLTALLLFVVIFVRVLQMLMRERSAGFLKSGIVISTVCVQSVALVANLAMALLPCPVLYDQVTGLRSHLIRYAEWIALSFLMVFLTDNIDSQTELRFQTAACIALSTAAGIVLPLCRHLAVWVAVFLVATALFAEIYFLLYRRAVAFGRIRDKMSVGVRQLQLTAADHEEYEIARSSFLLTAICSTAWTVLVVSYVAVGALPRYLPAAYLPVSALSLHSCANEVLSKIWYLNTLLETYDTIFDVTTRMTRRLEELRRFMSAVWQSSSDVIIFCVANNRDRISARISPAFMAMSGLQMKGFSEGYRDVSILMDVHPQSGTFTLYGLDLSQPLGRESVSVFQRALHSSNRTKYNFQEGNDDIKDYPEDIQNVAILAREIAQAMTKDQGKKGTDCKDGDDTAKLRYSDMADVCFLQNGKITCCETKISSLHDDCMVLVLRDISDRVERFAVEKKLVEEQAIRSKDAETNHFTRHEVKNGILASIGLLDHMRYCMKKKLATMTGDPCASSSSETSSSLPRPLTTEQPRPIQKSISNNSLHSVKDPESGVVDTLEELDSTLHDVLDTILDEVMAREIIYGEYKPRKERIDVRDVLMTLRRGSSSRFPLELYPSQFPLLVLDRQLLRHVYRNALSNACRYGKFNGEVKTILRYDDTDKVLSMKVINQPGEEHDKLLQLSDEAVASIFDKGTQLEATKTMNNVSKNSEPRKESSGNGAWIMSKCAETMDGNCNIKFNVDSTVFTFQCPVDAVRIGSDSTSGEAHAIFVLPPGTQCVVVEDSQVQRKLLDRMLQNLGIPSTHRLVLGRDSAEILGFPQRVSELLRQHLAVPFLLIVDENLDVVPNGGVDIETVSGSKLIEQLRRDLEPELESRILALVRSANDSTRDIEIYLKRAHGFLLKEPLKKGQFVEAIRPWWGKRFPHQTQVFSDRSAEEEVLGPLPDDIRTVLDQIHSLCSNHEVGVLGRRWSVIRDKLLSLKGDLKTLSSKDKVIEVIQDLESLQCHKRLPEDFFNTWTALRERIEKLL